MMIKRLICTTGIVVLAFISFPLQAVTVYIEATQDNTLYESSQGAVSNGAGTNLYSGRTDSAGVRRAVIALRSAGG